MLVLLKKWQQNYFIFYYSTLRIFIMDHPNSGHVLLSDIQVPAILLFCFLPRSTFCFSTVVGFWETLSNKFNVYLIKRNLNEQDWKTLVPDYIAFLIAGLNIDHFYSAIFYFLSEKDYQLNLYSQQPLSMSVFCCSTVY